MSDTAVFFVFIVPLMLAFWVVMCRAYDNQRELQWFIKLRMPRCFDCGEPIHVDDEACVCVECGGMNRRMR